MRDARARRALIVLSLSAGLALTGCSTGAPDPAPAAAAPTATAPSATGSLELAASETCAEGTDPLCTSAGDTHVRRPDGFERAQVASAEVTTGLSSDDDPAELVALLTGS